MPPGCRPASLPDLARRRQAQRDQQQPQVKVRQCPAVWSKLMAASAPRMPSCGCPAAAARWRRSSRVYQAADLRQQRRRSWWRRPRQGIEAGAAEEQREAGGGGQDKESKLALLRSSGGEVGGGGQDKESKLALLRSSSGEVDYNFMRMFLFPLHAIIFGTTFYLLSAASVKKINPHIGLIYSSMDFTGVINLMTVLEVTCAERAVFYRESGVGQ
ncbi:hypothetical protein PF005_g19825 [Phytophthora fragariae]|uniref:Uncharacterized protein n=1 Tax=Phytophthora fragariae TaxID=53985 RepID=A0A6A3WWW1_9STRA|nr:hypothetical protein PF010_g19316 [Phytophthora fragariae]KAE9088642.1 hypothetical protein PF007_g19902 [Phytophthora fragariae]KAE9173757.1 hypothetical protein PF004_g26866 [Phytophthora fragariae]KAE9189013.1 hypothetical protein PF005_g19825 [Phytophthora fragariae]